MLENYSRKNSRYQTNSDQVIGVVTGDLKTFMKGVAKQAKGGKAQTLQTGSAILRNFSLQNMPEICAKVMTMIRDSNVKDTVKATLILAMFDRAAGKVTAYEDYSEENGESQKPTFTDSAAMSAIDYFNKIVEKANAHKPMIEGNSEVSEGKDGQ